jgi:hypothetical protein
MISIKWLGSEREWISREVLTRNTLVPAVDSYGSATNMIATLPDMAAFMKAIRTEPVDDVRLMRLFDGSQCYDDGSMYLCPQASTYLINNMPPGLHTAFLVAKGDHMRMVPVIYLIMYVVEGKIEYGPSAPQRDARQNVVPLPFSRFSLSRVIATDEGRFDH